MHTAFNASLLKLERERRGWSQTFLAERLAVKQAALSKYERGAVEPPAPMQERIAETFDLPIEFFRPETAEIPTGLIFHRKRAAAPARVRSMIEADARLRLLDVLRLAAETGLRSRLIERQKTPEETAVALRRFWNVPKGPIDNFIDLLEQNGVVVLEFDFGTDLLDAFFVRLDVETDLVCIVLNSNEAFSPDRIRFTLAHELGHALLHRDAFPDKKAENEANNFAAELLAPAKDVAPDLTRRLDFERLKALKAKWKMSTSALIYRAKDLGILPESAARRYWMYLSQMQMRKNEPLCGLVRETPSKLEQMLKTQSEQTPNMPEWLRISDAEFERRYPRFNALK
ncbi:MAG: ImmA/IrrE family metallo-endopeptidase [Thermoguttaceae bacterium]|nr:ImmA/IrrE family metallo-endopeptidase [Thermoguttaceae bacterium]